MLIDVETVARMLSCSTRHVYRLADAGRMPRKLEVGRSARWRRAEVEQWIKDDCPRSRN